MTRIVPVLLLLLTACTHPKPIVTTKVQYVMYPKILDCTEYTLQSCAPTTNGQLFLCAIELQRQLQTCHAAVDTFNAWQENKVSTYDFTQKY